MPGPIGIHPVTVLMTRRAETVQSGLVSVIVEQGMEVM
jgi:hypothetical protein